MINEILSAHLSKNRPRTQEDCINIAIRQNLASCGELPDELRSGACYNLVKGLFGPAFITADMAQKLRWFKMAKRQYQKITNK